MSKATRYFELTGTAPADYVYQPGAHRYLLTFQSRKKKNGKTVAVIQLNGSTASSGTKSNSWEPDPTSGKVLCWCHAQTDITIATVHLLNLFSFVETSPSKLKEKGLNELNRVENDEHIKAICRKADIVIVAYGKGTGVPKPVFRRRIKEVMALLEGKPLHHVGPLTKGGYPLHGLMWNNQPTLSHFSPR